MYAGLPNWGIPRGRAMEGWVTPVMGYYEREVS